MNKIITTALMAIPFVGMAQNPIIQTKYTPDPAPFVYKDTVYLFVDHDEDDAQYFKMKDWMLYSSTDMVNWTYCGTPISTQTFAWAKQGDRAWASQAVEHNGKWYWYLCCNTEKGEDALAVAVADYPQGPYVDAIGAPLAIGFSFIDPTVFVDDDGQAYLFWGNKGCWYGKLNADMVSFADGYKEVPGFHDPACFGPESKKMNWAKGKEEMMVGYEEGPWVMKRNGVYYLTYPSGGVPEHMAYSTAPTIDGPWTYKGRIMDEAENSFTIHGGNITFKGHDYMFYHNGILPNGGGFRRSTCIEEFTWNPDGSIPFIPFTKEGVAPVGCVNPYQRVEAETIAWSEGVQTDNSAGSEHYVTSIHNNDYLKVRNVDFGSKAARSFTASVAGVLHPASIEIRLDAQDGPLMATLPILADALSSAWRTFSVKTQKIKGVHDVYFVFKGGEGDLFLFDWWSFR